MKTLLDYIKEDIFDVDSKVIYTHDFIGKTLDEGEDSSFYIKDIRGKSAIIISRTPANPYAIDYDESILPKLVKFGIKEFVFESSVEVPLFLPNGFDEPIKFKSVSCIDLIFDVEKQQDITLSNVSFEATAIHLKLNRLCKRVNVQFNNVTFKCNLIETKTKDLMFYLNNKCKFDVNYILFNWRETFAGVVKDHPVFKKFKEIMNSPEGSFKEPIGKLFGIGNVNIKSIHIIIGALRGNGYDYYRIIDEKHCSRSRGHVIGNGYVIQRD